jgi:hypothetical protein
MKRCAQFPGTRGKIESSSGALMPHFLNHDAKNGAAAHFLSETQSGGTEFFRARESCGCTRARPPGERDRNAFNLLA